MNNLSQLPNSKLTPSLAREFIMKEHAKIKKAYNNQHPQPPQHSRQYNLPHGGRHSRKMTRRVKGRKGCKTRSCKK